MQETITSTSDLVKKSIDELDKIETEDILFHYIFVLDESGSMS